MRLQLASFSPLLAGHFIRRATLTIEILRILLTAKSNALNIGDLMRILKIKEVLQKTGLGKTTMYKLMKSLDFPQAIPLGLRAVGWLDSEIETWIQKRVDARNQHIS